MKGGKRAKAEEGEGSNDDNNNASPRKNYVEQQNEDNNTPRDASSEPAVTVATPAE